MLPPYPQVSRPPGPEAPHSVPLQALCQRDGQKHNGISHGEKSHPETNKDQQATITVVKEVINNNRGSAGPNDFGLTLAGTGTTSGTPVQRYPGRRQPLHPHRR
jgi:hypothetical protein